MQKIEHFWETIGSPQALSYKDFYSEIVQKYPSGSLMVEVGVYHGRSFSYLIVEMLNAGKKFDCVAVDACPWERGSSEPGDGEPCRGFYKAMVPLEGHYRTMFDQVDSFVAAQKFADGSIDMCWIDANHEYDFISKDIRAYLPKMKKGGTLAGHDISYHGVAQAVKEIFGDSATIDTTQDLWRIEIQ